MFLNETRYTNHMQNQEYLYQYDFPTSMAEIELIKMGEKGQIVIPKKIRDDLKIEKGTRLIIIEEDSKITIKKATLEEDQLWMLAGEETLKKTWNNKHDERWNDAL